MEGPGQPDRQRPVPAYRSTAKASWPTFEANESYWEGRPKLDGVELVYIKDSAVALEAYRAGQLDVMSPELVADPAC